MSHSNVDKLSQVVEVATVRTISSIYEAKKNGKRETK